MGSALGVYEVIYAAEGRHLPIQPRGDPSRCMPAHIALRGMLIGMSRPGLWLQHSCDTPLCCNPCPPQPGRAAEKYADQGRARSAAGAESGTGGAAPTVSAERDR